VTHHILTTKKPRPAPIILTKYPQNTRFMQLKKALPRRSIQDRTIHQNGASSSMSTHTGSTTIPCLRYRDALAAIDWLVRVFGFTRQAVHLAADNKTVMHAQLTLGQGMIMIDSAEKGGEYSKLMVHPDEIGLRQTQSICLVVPDADAVYAQAKAAGAPVVMEIADKPYGGRDFGCRDLEGYLWYIGTYNPWNPSQP
jgi:uncharacterized glyoxalase superfamily protein PhnB